MTEAYVERLFSQYADTVYRVCRTYLGSEADSEDPNDCRTGSIQFCTPCMIAGRSRTA